MTAGGPSTGMVTKAAGVLASSRVMTLTEARRIGLEALLVESGMGPLTITKRGKAISTLLSQDHLETIRLANAEVSASALRALAEMVDRLNLPEVLAHAAVVDSVLDAYGAARSDRSREQ